MVHPFPVVDKVNEPKYVGYHLIAEDAEMRPASLSYVKPSELLIIANALVDEVTSLRSRLGAVERERDEAQKENAVLREVLEDERDTREMLDVELAEVSRLLVENADDGESHPTCSAHLAAFFSNRASWTSAVESHTGDDTK